MPAKRLELEFKGLVTAPAVLAAAPGALTAADNVDFPAPGLATKRRGVKQTAYGFTGPCWSVISTKQLGANLLFNANGASGTQLQYGDGTVANTLVTTPDSTNFANSIAKRMKGAVSLRNHYLTSSRATGRLNSDFSFKFAGMSRSPGMHWRQQNATQLNGTGTWLAVGYAVAYRVVWVGTDADGTEIVSAPSGRWVVANVATTAGYTGAARSTKLNIQIPYQTETASTALPLGLWKFRVYRSFSVNTATAQPNDEMQMCFEGSPTAPELAAGYVTVDDLCPESALGAYLYTNTVSGGDVTGGAVAPGSTSLGMAASNDRPPIAQDIAVYADCAFYAATTTPHRYRFSILATGVGGLAVGDTLTVDTTVYTGVAGAPVATTDFRVEVGLGSVTLNIRQTAMNLVAAINTSHPTLTAAYIGSDASPGTIGAILLERRRTDTSSAFTVLTSGVATSFLPPLNGNTASTQDVFGNGLAISKPFQADSVPPANYLRVGRNDAAIQRVMPLRDALYVFTDDGIYWVRGSSPADFVVEAFDLTFRLLARETLVSTGDALYAWGREGIARITNGGVEYLDLPIRNYVQAAQRGINAALSISDFSDRAFAVAYSTQRRVVFWFPSGGEGASDSYCTLALVFHVPTGAWSTYSVYDKTAGYNTGCVRWSDELSITGDMSGRLFVERAPGDADEYNDSDGFGDLVNITSTLTWVATTPNPAEVNHWSELQLMYAPDPFATAYACPSPNITITSEHGGSMSSTVTQPTSSSVQARIILSPVVGVATRQTLTVSSTSGYFGSSGFVFIYTPISGFTVR